MRPIEPPNPDRLILERESYLGPKLGWPALIFGLAATLTGAVQLIRGAGQYSMYFAILIGLGLPCLWFAVEAICRRSGVVLDRREREVVTWSHLLWSRRQETLSMDAITAVVLLKYWNPSKTEDAYLYRVVLRADGEAARDVPLEHRLHESDGRAFQLQLAAFLDLPAVEERERG